MPSRSNPNTPTSLKPKSARTLKTKRQHTQRLSHNRIAKPQTARTSQALRQAAVPSKKKARKVETRRKFARARGVEEMIAAGEVEMKDLDAATAAGGKKKNQRRGGGRSEKKNAEGEGEGGAVETMEIDGVQGGD